MMKPMKKVGIAGLGILSAGAALVAGLGWGLVFLGSGLILAFMMAYLDGEL